MKKILLIIIGCFVLSSCSFNHFFYFTSTPYVEIQGINYEEVEITNHKNKKLHGIILRPSKRIAKANIIFLHGNGGNVSTWIHRVKPFADHGYNVLLFDYEGYGKSEGKPSHKNLLKDSQLFLDYLVNNNKTENLKIVLMGHSMGGNLAVEIAKRNQDKIDVLIIEGAFSSHKNIAIRFVPDKIKPLAKLLVRAPYSALEAIKEIKNMQKLIIHSYEDQVCLMSMSEQLFEDAVEPKELWKINGEHCRAIFYYEKEYIEKTDSLLILSNKNNN
ncbi:MAG: alpha/beta fold hydrolase [Bacteroidetes bacterium]|nr:alpha/beta fold hydrolase [Bacteroidota bacterium]HET6244600.1 alpha/beta fold hydrolase [Bacteroidia bacterium]